MLMIIAAIYTLWLKCKIGVQERYVVWGPLSVDCGGPRNEIGVSKLN